MEGDFYKCEEVAFSEGISSSVAMAALIAQAASACQMYFLFFIFFNRGAKMVHKTDIYHMMILSLFQKFCWGKQFCFGGN